MRPQGALAAWLFLLAGCIEPEPRSPETPSVEAPPRRKASTTITADRDTTIVAGSPGNANGGAGALYVGRGAGGAASAHRALVRFNLSALAYSSVSSATLNLYVNRVPGGVSVGPIANNFRVAMLTSTWTEGTANGGHTGLACGGNGGGATWNTRDCANAWVNGGSFGGWLSETAIGTTTGWRQFTGLGATVNTWANGSDANNHGFVVFSASEGTNGTVRRLDARSVANAPYLSVTFECNLGRAWGTSCAPISSYCAAAPTIANDIVGSPSVSGGLAGGSTTSLGAIADYTCSNGYTQSGADPTCNTSTAAAGVWSNSVSCGLTPNYCPVPPSIANDTDGSPTATRTLGGVADYTCNVGYSQTGADPTCNASTAVSGVWSNTVTCNVNTTFCPLPPTVTNATYTFTGGLSPGNRGYLATADYTCSVGYLQTNADPTCQSNQTWSLPTPVCNANANHCPNPTTIANGTYTRAGGLAGSETNSLNTVATYTCSPGYGPGGTSTCGTGGTWTAAPACNVVTSLCDAGALPVTNATYVVSGGLAGGSTTSYNAIAAYTCSTGYTKSGADRTCQANGLWTAAPSCSVNDTFCVAAPVVSNAGAATLTGGLGGNGTRSLGASASYTCNTGYVQSGSSATCLASGQWSAAPTCAPRDCGAPPVVANAGAPLVSGGAGGGSTTTYLATAAYTCNGGYQKTGGNPTCGAGGSWSAAPTCTNIDECATVGICGVGTCSDTAGAYTCSCPPGYTFDGTTCTVSNACIAGAPPCDANATCTPVGMSSFSCACNAGYTGSGVGAGSCADVDECALNTDDCNAPNATCTNTTGSFTCGCATGYTGDGVTACTNVNECANPSRPCTATQACTDTPGSFACTSCGANATPSGAPGAESCGCNAGYTGDPLAGCTDVNECALPSRPCTAGQACTNVPGSAQCTTCHANASVVGAPGAEACVCNGGYAGNGLACADVDECVLGTDDCSAVATCTNTIGGFTCACNAGYAGNGVVCTDVDECAGANDCDAPQATCTNTPGSYTCGCASGYAGDGITSCVNVNECALPSRPCSPTQACVDTSGSFRCDPCGANAQPAGAPGAESCVCLSGYEGNATAGCTDVNECAEAPRPCLANEACTNTPSTFVCDGCGANATPGGIPGDESCFCDEGFAGDPFTACTNVDECAAGTDNCSENASCSDTNGGYDCTCDEGYAGDGFDCANVDECMTGANDCDVNADCTDVPGSFTCTCYAGYTGDGTTCEDEDECALGTDLCSDDATCEDTEGAYTCTCEPGFQGTGLVCTDVDDCVGSTVCGANEVCVNRFGQPHGCDCEPGFLRQDGNPSAPCVSTCGNGQRAARERCDDGNRVNGDGCDEDCRVEPGFACYAPTAGGPSVCAATCGDGLIDAPAETCDDAAANDDDTPNACRTDCILAGCNDGVLDDGEACDEGAANSDTLPDACRTTCVRAFCGDGVVDPARGERCDNGYGAPLEDSYCSTKSGCRRPVLYPDGGVHDAAMGPGKDGGCGVRVFPSGAREEGTLLAGAVLAVALALRRRRRTS